MSVQRVLPRILSLFSWKCQRSFKLHKNPKSARTILFGENYGLGSKWVFNIFPGAEVYEESAQGKGDGEQDVHKQVQKLKMLGGCFFFFFS